jgi:formiminotetrahydrofolate cyclodeaminase
MDELMLVDKPLSAVLEEFRSSAPTPGGGSAAALAGALGASLLAMVAGLPKPRAATPDDAQKLSESGERCTRCARQLERLVDADSDAYAQVLSAYRLPKSTDEEKQRRSDRIQDALRAAVGTPLDVMRASTSALEEEPVLRDLSNPNAASDVGVAVELLRAARRGARLNVEINLGTVKDSAYVARIRDEIDHLDPQLPAQ